MSWFARLLNTFRRDRLQRDIDREMSFHLAERADELRAGGLSADEAARRARLQFGNIVVQSERTQDVDIAQYVDGLLRNLRYAIRSLTRTPSFTIGVVLTLALGIGANSIVFSAIDAVLLQPLPFPDGDRLMQLRQTQERAAETNIAPVRLEDWNGQNATFEAITGYYMENVSETSGDLPEKIRRAWVSRRFLDVWGIAPARGRGFTEAEYTAGGPSAVLISDRYWRRRFGGDENILTRTVRIGAASVPIVGVMPASFRFPDRDVDLWFPVALGSKLAQFRNATWYIGIGRLKPGVTVQQARVNLAAVQAQLGKRYPDPDSKIGVEVTPLKDVAVGGVRASLWLMFAAVSVLLLITCTNISALLLSRAAHRRQEIAVRVSLGATRGVVAAQMLTETCVLSLAGGAMGLLVAAGASAALRSMTADLPRMDEVEAGGRMLLYTMAVVVMVALLCGLLPAIRIARSDLAGAPETGRAQVSSRNFLPWLLVGTQVALSVTLLAGAGLLARSFYEVWRLNPGFDASHVLTFRVSGNWNETADIGRLVQRIDGTLEELRALPGVQSAATAIFLPGVPAQYESTFDLVEAQRDSERRMIAETRIVSPEYFGAMQIPLIGGRPCGRQPRGRPADVMVNRAFATRYLSARSSAAGLHLAAAESGSPPLPIVGVVGDARERGLDRDSGPTVYWCISAPNPMPYFLVRTRGEPLAIAQTVRLKIKELDPLRAVYDISPLTERIGDAYTQNRLRTTVLILFAVTALALTCVGLYGTLSYAVSLRRREVGLRLALGATRSGIVRHFLVQGLRVVAVACLCGLALTLAVSRVLSTMLYGISPFDPVTLSTVIGVVLAVTALAALVPGARAAAVEPRQVLHEG